jgi:hypothetical protein
MSRFKHWTSKCKWVNSSGGKVYFPFKNIISNMAIGGGLAIPTGQ